MPQITYTTHKGVDQVVDVPLGWSLMEGAVKNDVSGVLADCGGSCVCATCHIIIDDAKWRALIPPPSAGELEMIEIVAEPAEGSRLSCQVTVTEELDGLKVRLPASQL